MGTSDCLTRRTARFARFRSGGARNDPRRPVGRSTAFSVGADPKASVLNARMEHR